MQKSKINITMDKYLIEYAKLYASKICRRRGDDEIVICHDCSSFADETVKFVDFGPHDHAYGK